MRTFKKIYGLLLPFLTAFSAIAQPKINGSRLLNIAVNQYEKAEWDINVSAAYTNPYDQKNITLE